ncbi:xanthine dehydrogenase family protein molybdopterin-binding subunit [Haliangium ochraceum]|uniref:Aldehyde oxidase and xanthine dehydrogenase molybdopterin binding protein n=1 Tax=Haliangium ochraceum (strain DSM 14365 / JCM 11303 / SMP-2) TaxID=502025 RepID=D0LG87_HALO1|nr:xanthine dehydrogenase family protein molybdopterin-binding subunit [Haliangium ochraceum]ACY18112.1 aldehyde oxidase and xanthine dehydrogenase molybdopterin binding protein [Haliangium ochraceum DSM 14365]
MSRARERAAAPAAMTRRGFLRVGTAAGGALLVGVHLPGCARFDMGRRTMAEHAEKTGELMPNAWIRVTRDSEVVYTLDRVEMGQGTMTSHAMMVAEELEVEPAAIRIELAGAGRVYDNPELQFQITGGSTSVAASWEPLRKAAAATREMLRAAAAAVWEVPIASCEVSAGRITHAASGRSELYGAFTEVAALVPIPDPPLKARSEFRVLGTAQPRVDARAKVDGSAVFGIDVTVPEMLSAAIVRPPVIGGRVAELDASAALREPGVREVLELPSGVAVVADKYWQARRAVPKLVLRWDDGALGGLSSEQIRRDMAALADTPGKEVRGEGDVDAALARAEKVIDAVYEVPYLAHATMEPQNCAARVTGERCEIWAPTQSPGMAREIAHQITGLPHRDIEVHNTLLGGGFGRRIAQDYVAEAVHLSKRIGRAVKITWSREDDMRNDYYRPQTYNRLRGGVDAEGRLLGWTHRLVGPSIVAQIGVDWLSSIAPVWVPRVAKGMMGRSAARAFQRNWIADETSIEGAASMPYAIDDVRVEYVLHDPGVPVGFWRSVGHSENAFMVEGFIDELAHAAGRDPFAFRRELLREGSRNRAVLELAAEAAGWGQPLAEGRGRGIAQHASFGSYCAEVAEVSVEDGAVRVHRVVCAIDCGYVLNPDIVAAQMESAIVYGLSAALRQAITLRDGRVEQGNFHDYGMLRMHEMPRVEVHIVSSEAEPSGAGEPGLPPIAPAVVNAIFAATGQRIRRLPIEPELRRQAG